MNQRERQIAARLELPEYYERFHLPIFHAGVVPATVKSYRESLAHWRRITNSPPLAEVDCELLGLFKKRMADANFTAKKVGRPSAQKRLFDISPDPQAEGLKIKRYWSKPMSPGNVNKHLRQILAILNKAGPSGPRNRDALGIIDEVPWTSPLKVYRRRPRDIKDDLLTAIYSATDAALLPKSPGDAASYTANWWKALVVTALTVGYRRGGLLSLVWDDVDWQTRELRLEAEADKCDEERIKPFSELVAKHLLRIRTAGPFIFPWSNGMRVLPSNQTQFYKVWHSIQTAAGIAREKHIKIHDLKRACGSRFARVASPWAVMHRLDHASIDTSLHYINATPEEREAVEKVPLPSIFYADFADQVQSVFSG